MQISCRGWVSVLVLALFVVLRADGESPVCLRNSLCGAEITNSGTTAFMTGKSAQQEALFYRMADFIQHSGQGLSKADLKSVAVYLKDLMSDELSDDPDPAAEQPARSLDDNKAMSNGNLADNSASGR